MRWEPRAAASCLILAGASLCSGAGSPALESLAPHAAFPERIGFLEEGPKTLRLVGTVVRVRNGIPFYTLAYYVNLAELRAAAGPARSLPELAQVLVQGKVAQGYLTRFEQRVSRDRRMEFLVGNLRLYWDGPGFREDSPTLRSFLAYFDRGLERGEVTEVWIRNGAAYTRAPGRKPTRTADPALCRSFASSYLGDLRMPGADRILREDLLRDLPALLEAEPPRPRSSPR